MREESKIEQVKNLKVKIFDLMRKIEYFQREIENIVKPKNQFIADLNRLENAIQQGAITSSDSGKG